MGHRRVGIGIENFICDFDGPGDAVAAVRDRGQRSSTEMLTLKVCSDVMVKFKIRDA